LACIGCKDLFMEYGNGDSPVPVLKGITLSVESGEFAAIMGQSGSGKSTLLHCLGLLETPTAGEVKILGKDSSRLTDRQKADIRRETMGFVFQSFYLVPGLTVQENVLLPMLIHGSRAGRDKRAVRLLEQVGLSHRLRHKPNQLSGGEQQRVAIARALANSPQLLLLDEPTGNLDSATGESVLELLTQVIKNEGITTLMVTHSLEAAKRCGRIITIRDGIIVGDGY
jgi:putative ABC transport system ATP-binding protein